MRIYVAGRVAWINEVRRAQALARDAGHEITFDWTGPEGATRHDWTQERALAYEISSREIRAVATADAVILLGHGCEEGGGGLGCFIEVGMALAYGMPIFVVGPCRESVFWYQPNVWRCKTADEAISQLGIAVKAAHSSRDAIALLTQARREISNLRQVAWDCARIAGADLSYADGPQHGVFDPDEAVEVVREMRAELDDGVRDAF